MDGHPVLSDFILKHPGEINDQRLSGLIHSRGAVIFDADGTLWNDDLGDAFFAFLVKNGLVSARKLSEYQTLEAFDPKAAYGFAVQAMAGLSETQVLDLSDDFCEGWLLSRVRQDVVGFALALRKAGMRVEVISATAELIVRPAITRVLGDWAVSHGIRVEIKNGILTDILEQPLSFAEGKVEVFNNLDVGPLMIAVGDSRHDIPILRRAETGIWVGRVPAPDGLISW